jgi:hypothetical protein
MTLYDAIYNEILYAILSNLCKMLDSTKLVITGSKANKK